MTVYNSSWVSVSQRTHDAVITSLYQRLTAGIPMICPSEENNTNGFLTQRLWSKPTEEMATMPWSRNASLRMREGTTQWFFTLHIIKQYVFDGKDIFTKDLWISCDSNDIAIVGTNWLLFSLGFIVVNGFGKGAKATRRDDPRFRYHQRGDKHWSSGNPDHHAWHSGYE